MLTCHLLCCAVLLHHSTEMTAGPEDIDYLTATGYPDYLRCLDDIIEEVLANADIATPLQLQPSSPTFTAHKEGQDTATAAPPMISKYQHVDSIPGVYCSTKPHYSSKQDYITEDDTAKAETSAPLPEPDKRINRRQEDVCGCHIWETYQEALQANMVSSPTLPGRKPVSWLAMCRFI